jgi:hypothetical protein
MIRLPQKQQTKGTRILRGKRLRRVASSSTTFISEATALDFTEIVLPSLEPAAIYIDKAERMLVARSSPRQHRRMSYERGERPGDPGVRPRYASSTD